MQSTQLLGRILPGINRKIIEGVSKDIILDLIFDEFFTKIPYDRIGVGMLTEDCKYLEIEWVKSRIPASNLKKGLLVKLCKSSYSEVVEAGRPKVISNLIEWFSTHEDSITAKNAIADGINSNMICPIILDGKTVGAVFFSSCGLKTYREEHAKIFMDFTNEISIILTRDRVSKSHRVDRPYALSLSKAVHDFRSPLSVIQTCLDIMSKSQSSLSSDEKKIQKLLARSTKTLIALVENLSEINNLELEAGQLHKTTVDLSAFVEDECDQFAVICEKKNIKFHCELEVDGHFALFDRERITQALDNLITNAVKFSERGSEITFGAKVNENRLMFSLKDTGPGIPESELPILFQDFGKTSVRPTEGELSTGLGLSIVKRIVDLHQGQVFVESKVGQGSLFSFWIPILNVKEFNELH
jgi:K+-sensing histidine kinase KdpD